jgi:hypothetical protein
MRAGLQVRMDPLFSGNPDGGQERHLKHVYLFMEYQVTNATKNGVDLGGTALLGGVLFEF